MASKYPAVGFQFSVKFELSGATTTDEQFQEVSGLGREMTTEDVVEGGENRFTHKLPVRGSYSNLILKRGVFTSTELIKWAKDAIENFVFKPVNITIALLNEANKPIMTWYVIGAYPVKWSVSDFNATNNAIAIETIEMMYQYFKLEIVE